MNNCAYVCFVCTRNQYEITYILPYSDFAYLPIINGIIICSPFVRYLLVAPGNKITSQIRLLVINTSILMRWLIRVCTSSFRQPYASKFNPPPHLLAKIYCGCCQLFWPLLHGRRHGPIPSKPIPFSLLSRMKLSNCIIPCYR